MQPLDHQYSFLVRIFSLVTRITAFVFPAGFLIFVLMTLEIPFSLVAVPDILYLVFVVVLAWAFFLFSAYFYTGITSDQEGLHTTFLWMRLTVPWEDVIDQMPLYRLPFPKKVWVIRTRSLTPFHRLYGLFYTFSFHPGLVYSAGIAHFEELHQRVDQASQANTPTPVSSRGA